MSDLFSLPLREVLKQAASSEPTPGGGSVSAITLAFAASMAAMVANLTIGKKKYRDVEQQATLLRDRALCLMSRAEDLVDADIAQFRRFMECYRMPATTEEERQNKEHLVQQALKGATQTPLEIAGACIELLEIVSELAPIGNTMAISDAGVAAYLAEAALNAALLSVDINIPEIKDQAFVEEARAHKESLIKQAEKLRSAALSVIASRMNGT